MSGLTNPSPATNLKFDSSNNVLANINAQNINPNAESLNPYSLLLISHQTGLSVLVSTAYAPSNIGSAISITKTGIVKVSLKGHVSANQGLIDIALTRNSITYYYALANAASSNSSTKLNNSLFSDTYGAQNIENTSAVPLFVFSYLSNAGVFSLNESFSFNVINGDSIQFRASNSAASTTTYIDDMLLVMQ